MRCIDVSCLEMTPLFLSRYARLIYRRFFVPGRTRLTRANVGQNVKHPNAGLTGLL